MPRIKLDTEKGLAVAALLIVGLFFSAWLHLEQSFSKSRQDSVNAGLLRATQVAEVISQELDTTLHVISFLLQEIADDHLGEAQDFASAARHALSVLPNQQGVSVSLYDINGILVVSSGTEGLRDISKTTLFSALKESTPPAVAIGDPDQGPYSMRWHVALGQAIVHGGQHAGYLVADVPISLFSEKLSQIGLGPGDIAAIVRQSDQEVIASTADPILTGAVLGSNRRDLAPSGPTCGAVLQDASAAGPARIVAWNEVPTHGLVVFVTFLQGGLLTDVDRNIASDRSYFAISALLLLALMAVVAILLMRNARQGRALAQQEEMYHNLFEQNHSIKLISDPANGRIIAANRSAAEFYGYSREQLEHMRLDQINCLPPDQIKASLTEAIVGKRPYFLFPHRLASGEIRRVEVYSGPVKFGGHTVLYSIVHDVTDRFELEAQLKDSEERYRTLFQVVPTGIVMLNAKAEFTAFNGPALEMLLTDEDGLKSRSRPLFDPLGRPIAEAERPSRRALVQDLNHELFYVQNEDGSRTWLSFISRRLAPGADGSPQGAVIAFSNVTDFMRQEEQRLVSQLVFDSTTEGIMVTDADNRIVAVNRAFSAITGYASQEAIGQTPALLESGLHDEPFYRSMYESLRTKGSWEGEITNRHKSGHLFAERLVISTVRRPNGLASGYVAVFSDITARKEKEQLLWHQANFDPLTGLPNRTLLLDRATQALVQAHRRNQPVALLFIDLDRFKPVNDQFGHSVGDDVLRAVALRIQSWVRAEDTVARLGGDEFVVLLPMASDLDGASAVANKILSAINEPFVIGGRIISIGCCVGVAVSQHGEEEAEMLLKRADAAMYQAKEAGRGRVSIAA